jgi:hypothetical protein
VVEIDAGGRDLLERGRLHGQENDRGRHSKNGAELHWVVSSPMLSF